VSNAEEAQPQQLLRQGVNVGPVTLAAKAHPQNYNGGCFLLDREQNPVPLANGPDAPATCQLARQGLALFRGFLSELIDPLCDLLAYPLIRNLAQHLERSGRQF
jgi:hypothetical protein